MKTKVKAEQFIAKVKNTVARFNLLNEGDTVLLAVSGGPDSVALLNWFYACQNDYKLKLYIFHLNHLIRPEAKEEASFVRQLADSLALPFILKEFPVKQYCQEHKLSLQMGARIIRYQFLNEVASEIMATKIALAHQADDQAETVLRNLLKGTGLKGLAGIPIKRDNIIRPLLFCRRREILAYLEALGADFKVDPSNYQSVYLRNYIRLKILPLFLQQNPHFVEQILSLTELVSEDEAYLEQAAKKTLADESVHVNEELHLKLHHVKQLPPALGKRVVRAAVAQVKGDLHQLTYEHTNRIWEAMVQTEKLKAVNLPDKTVVLRENDCLVVYKPPEAAWQKIELKAGETVKFNRFQLSLALLPQEQVKFAPNVHWLDAAKISWPLYVRSFQPGDRFTPLGLTGTKKVHDFFVDLKIKKRERPFVPVIVDKDDNIVAVGPYRLDEKYKINKTTKTAAKIVVTVAKEA